MNNIATKVSWEINRRAIADIARASITSVVDAVIELLTNVDDSYERLCKDKDKSYLGKCLIKYKRGGNNADSFLEIFDSAEGMSYKDIEQNLKIGEYSSRGSTRGHFSKGLKDLSLHGKVVLKSIKDNLYNEVEFTLLEEGYTIKPPVKATQTHINDLNLRKKNKNGTKIEFTISKKSRITHTTFEHLVNSLQTHYMLKNILHAENKTLNVLIQNMNDKSHKPQLLIHTPPKIKKVIHKGVINHQELDEYNNFYKPTDNVFFELYEIEEDEKTPDNYSICGIYIEGNKQVYSKGIFDMDKNNPHFKKIFGVVKSTLLDKTLEVFRDNYETNNTKLNPFTIIEPTRRGGLDWSHPLLKKMTRKPRSILKNYVSELDQKNRNIDFHSSTKKLITDISNLIAQEMEELNEDISSQDRQRISSMKFGQWIPIPKLINLHPEEEKTIYIYTHKSTLNDANALLTIKLNEEDKDFVQLINETSKAIETSDEDKYRFSFRVNALKPKSNINLSFFYDGNFSSKKTEIFINIEDYKDREFKKDFEFEEENYSVKFNGSRKVKIFKKYTHQDPLDITTKITTDNLNDVSLNKKEILLSRFKDTNYLVGEATIFGKKHGGKANLIAELDDKYRDIASVTVQNKISNNKHDFIVKPDENISDFRYYWGFEDTDRNTLYLCIKHPTFKLAFKNENDIKRVDNTVEGRVFYCEIISEAVAEKKVASFIDKDPKGKFNNELANVPEVFRNIKSNFAVKLYELMFKNNN